MCLALAAPGARYSLRHATLPLALELLFAAFSIDLFKAQAALGTLLFSLTSLFHIELSFFSPLLGPETSESPFC